MPTPGLPARASRRRGHPHVPLFYQSLRPGDLARAARRRCHSPRPPSGRDLSSRARAARHPASTSIAGSARSRTTAGSAPYFFDQQRHRRAPRGGVLTRRRRHPFGGCATLLFPELKGRRAGTASCCGAGISRHQPALFDRAFDGRRAECQTRDRLRSMRIAARQTADQLGRGRAGWTATSMPVPQKLDWSRPGPLRGPDAALCERFRIPCVDARGLIEASNEFWEYPMCDRFPLPHGA